MTDLLLRRVFALRQASRVIRVTDDRQERIRRRVYGTADGDVLSIPIPRVETGGDPAFPRADAARAPDVAVSALPWPFTKIQEAGQQ
jgi:hypothetical protein